MCQWSLGRGFFVFLMGFLLLLSLYSCSTESDPSETQDDRVVPEDGRVVAERQMEDLQVPEDFDWMITLDISLNLKFVNKKGNPLMEQPIEIYRYSEGHTLESKNLLFSGWSNQQGSLTLAHRINKGARSLLVKIGHAGVIREIPLLNLSRLEKEGVINLTFQI